MAALPWADAKQINKINIDGLDPLWVAVPENRALVDRVLKLQEEERYVDEMCQKALVNFRQAAVEEVVSKLRAIHSVIDIIAMDERNVIELLSQIAEAMEIPADLRKDILIEATEIARRTDQGLRPLATQDPMPKNI